MRLQCRNFGEHTHSGQRGEEEGGLKNHTGYFPEIRGGRREFNLSEGEQKE